MKSCSHVGDAANSGAAVLAKRCAAAAVGVPVWAGVFAVWSLDAPLFEPPPAAYGAVLPCPPPERNTWCQTNQPAAMNAIA